MATQSPNDDYVPWKRRSSRRRSRKQTLQKNSFSNFQEKTKTGNLPVARANERDKVEIPSWNFENECFSRDESKWKRGTKIRQSLRSTWVGSHWRWPEQTTTTRLWKMFSICLLPRNFNSFLKHKQKIWNVDDWPSWLTNSKKPAFCRLHRINQWSRIRHFFNGKN